jgi:CHAT domain-containing protein
LLIEADAGLRGLPFRALPTPDGEFLGIRKPVALIPGLWVLGPNSLRLPQYSSVGLLSASEHDSSLADSDETRALTFGTAHEQRIVVADFLDASRRLDSADFVYYSGHASEGEVAQVAVSLPRTLRRCRYVVVAACSSGTSLELSSDVYELLPERLLQAGVVGVVATRWNVDSGRTQQLMLNFGKSLTEGANLEVALQQASAELFAAGDRHPFYWAAFDVFGT